jgi:3(or 17)beta-hydroxysteroid dehydrogenase
MRLKGKKALITGAARGIGAAIAQAFAKEGAFVILADIEDATELAKELGGQYVHLDVADEKAWNAFESSCEGLQILVNNAGISGMESSSAPMNPEECSLADWDRIHRVNLNSVFFGCRTGIRLMKKTGGSIINLSSRSGMVGIPSLSPYASSKAAIRNHTKSVALYCAEKNYSIRCNSIHPASILTPMWEKLLGEGEEGKKKMERIAQTIPLKHFGEPQDVAHVAVFLASDESKFMTGSEIVIDGGILAGSAASPQK